MAIAKATSSTENTVDAKSATGNTPPIPTVNTDSKTDSKIDNKTDSSTPVRITKELRDDYRYLSLWQSEWPYRRIDDDSSLRFSFLRFSTPADHAELCALFTRLQEIAKDPEALAKATKEIDALIAYYIDSSKKSDLIMLQLVPTINNLRSLKEIFFTWAKASSANSLTKKFTHYSELSSLFPKHWPHLAPFTERLNLTKLAKVEMDNQILSIFLMGGHRRVGMDSSIRKAFFTNSAFDRQLLPGVGDLLGNRNFSYDKVPRELANTINKFFTTILLADCEISDKFAGVLARTYRLANRESSKTKALVLDKVSISSEALVQILTSYVEFTTYPKVTLCLDEKIVDQKSVSCRGEYVSHSNNKQCSLEVTYDASMNVAARQENFKALLPLFTQFYTIEIQDCRLNDDDLNKVLLPHLLKLQAGKNKRYCVADLKLNGNQFTLEGLVAFVVTLTNKGSPERYERERIAYVFFKEKILDAIKKHLPKDRNKWDNDAQQFVEQLHDKTSLRDVRRRFEEYYNRIMNMTVVEKIFNSNAFKDARVLEPIARALEKLDLDLNSDKQKTLDAKHSENTGVKAPTAVGTTTNAKAFASATAAAAAASSTTAPIVVVVKPPSSQSPIGSIHHDSPINAGKSDSKDGAQTHTNTQSRLPQIGTSLPISTKQLKAASKLSL